MRLWLAVAAFAAIGMVACGRYAGDVPGGRHLVVSPPTSALVPWRGFPADQQPRPIVWLENRSPANGFFTGDAKIAFMCSRFVLGSPLPTNVPVEAVATWTDGTSAVYPGISAAGAFAAMTRVTPEMTGADCAYVPGLSISSARLGAFDFYTDRGKAQMTAWLFASKVMNGEFAYPAIAPAAFWNGGLTAHAAGRVAGISSDGRSLTWTFAGAPDTPGPCGADYAGVVAESNSAVAVALQMFPHAAPAEPIACDAMAQERTITITLARPLGGRVVADETGLAVAVCPTGVARAC
jgi:hypothetical protein